MSWRHLIDTRQEKATVDWPRLIIVLVAGQAIAGVLVWLLSQMGRPALTDPDRAADRRSIDRSRRQAPPPGQLAHLGRMVRTTPVWCRPVVPLGSRLHRREAHGYGTSGSLGNVGRPDVDLTYLIRPDDVVAELEDRLRPFGRWRPTGSRLKCAACALTGRVRHRDGQPHT